MLVLNLEHESNKRYQLSTEFVRQEQAKTRKVWTKSSRRYQSQCLGKTKQNGSEGWAWFNSILQLAAVSFPFCASEELGLLQDTFAHGMFVISGQPISNTFAQDRFRSKHEKKSVRGKDR